jgi:hypothetical protein
MALAMKEFTINFGSASGSKQTGTQTVSFAANVKGNAQAVLKGYNVRYTNGDRELKEIEVDLDVIEVANNDVEVRADLLLRDASGNIDDPFQGFVQGVVIADTV